MNIRRESGCQSKYNCEGEPDDAKTPQIST